MFIFASKHAFTNFKTIIWSYWVIKKKGIVVGIGIETSGLHEKLALKVCILSGSDPKW